MQDTLSPQWSMAMREALKGRPFFPVRPFRKSPLTRHGYRDATCDPVQLSAWARRFPDAWIASPTGRGVVVLDIDPRSGGSLDPTLPPTLTIRTPSGGWHLYWTVKCRVPCSASRVRDGWDIRGDGGYVVVPPSPGYEVDSSRPAEALPMPADLLASATGVPPRAALCLEDALRTKRMRRLSQTYEPPERLSKGARNDGVARHAGHLLATGVPLDDLADELHDFNTVTCEPPLSRDEVERIAASIQRTAARRALLGQGA